MGSKDERPTRLSMGEKYLAIGMSLAFISFCAWVIYRPPVRSEDKVVVYSGEQIRGEERTITHIQSDQTKLVMALLSASAALIFYAINGFRFSRISMGSFNMGTDSSRSVRTKKKVKK